MSAIQENLKKSNIEYASTFDKGHLPLPPGKKYLVLTCMDARIDPAAALGIDLGDAHVIRNAGASARDALRSIVISQQLLGTREIVLVKHTGCGMLTFSNDDARALVKQNLGQSAAAEVAGLDFLPFGDLEKAVREDVEFLRGSGVVITESEGQGSQAGGGRVSGWVYEVESGKVREVV
ncbi:carbonate dehydratase [Microdochium trichocladiopsis]|uniref:Carbonic anhydrase n=1 Tax=Microdochium trichocladiopsis TaxID=1682393 RepID=A0A9P8YDE9_9PEZI|nr:carbonate dehydratase [Microdochium trichocladiopsis]KAH7035870.1 carbonate dehydratase [Microdochium trichocladiopsis]